MNTRKLTTLAITVTLAMALSFLESQIPPLVAIPGVKLGLANVAVIFALYRFGVREAAAVSALRVFLVGLLFGSFVSTLYSIVGAILSFAVMLLLRRFKIFSEVGVSVAGGVCHNIGQIAVACVLLETNVILYYLPFLLLSGTVAGVGVGALSALLIRKLKI